MGEIWKFGIIFAILLRLVSFEHQIFVVTCSFISSFMLISIFRALAKASKIWSLHLVVLYEAYRIEEGEKFTSPPSISDPSYGVKL